MELSEEERTHSEPESEQEKDSNPALHHKFPKEIRFTDPRRGHPPLSFESSLNKVCLSYSVLEKTLELLRKRAFEASVQRNAERPRIYSGVLHNKRPRVLICLPLLCAAKHNLQIRTQNIRKNGHNPIRTRSPNRLLL